MANHPIEIDAEEAGTCLDDFELNDNETTDIKRAMLCNDYKLLSKVWEEIQARYDEWIIDLENSK